jgi:hypothetical protein
MRFILFVLALSCSTLLWSQDSLDHHFKGVFFPYPMDRNTKFSIGFTNTTMPYDITEELHYRIPALDLHWLKKITPKLALNVRGSLQGFQNLVSVGPRWATILSDRYSVAIGNDFGYWIGFVEAQGISTRGQGFQNVPNFSIGHRFKKKVLLTFRADAQMNFGISTYAKNTKLFANQRLLSGSSYAIIMEQPFYGKKALTIGFRAIYTDFFWQTWTLFESFDRNIFYPQIIVGLNL